VLVTVKFSELLSFMFGATDTNSGPDVAPEGIVIVIEVALHEVTFTDTPFRRTKLPLCVAPNPDPEIAT
jgi:hypothetical protein